MRRKCLIACFASVFLMPTLAFIASAQDQKNTLTREDRLSGTVHAIDKNTSSIITVRDPAQGYRCSFP